MNKKIQPTTSTDWQVLDALRGVVRPYRSGSAYNIARVETHDGSRTIVHGLHERSRQWANVGEVADALNRAHLDALGIALSGESNRTAILTVLRRAFDLNDTELSTASVLVCDALGYDAWGSGSVWDTCPGVLRRLSSMLDDHTLEGQADVGDVVGALRASVMVNR